MNDRHLTEQRPSDVPGRLIACPDCDLLQHEVLLNHRSNAHCPRCDAVLYRSTHFRLDSLIALTSSAALLLLLSNLFPIALLAAQGIERSTTLAGIALVLNLQGRSTVALLVVLTTIVIPALQLAVLLFTLVSLRLGRIPPGAPFMFRLLVRVTPWSMMEVFFLGTLVTLVKLKDLATVTPGPSLWAFALLIVLFAAISAQFNVRDFWAWVDVARACPRPNESVV